jgi:hypothetical protein
VEYLDFELEVADGDGGDYTVSVLRSPAGEARAAMRFPYDELELRNKVQALQIALLRSGGPPRRSATREDRSVEELGRDLFGALFAGEVATRLEVTRSLAHQQGRGVRLKLRISSPELLSLPWEYLYDTDIGDYVALSVGTPLVRYIPLPQQIEPLEITPPIRVLGMIAGPTDLGELDGDREKARLEMALDELRKRGVVELAWVPGETWEDLQEALWGGPWHIFHFVGHGGFNERQGQGVIYLADAEGKSRELSSTDLARLLGDHDALRLAVLNSCDTAQGTQNDIFSSTAAALVRRGTPAVVAMQFQITDAAAIQFSRVFYRAIGRGMPVDAAVAEARKSIALQVANSLEWGTPVLFMRSPDGLLFKVPAAAAAIAGEAGSAIGPSAGLAPAADGVAAAREPAAPEAEPLMTTPAPVDPGKTSLPAAVPADGSSRAASGTGVAFQVATTTPELSLGTARHGTAEYTVRNLTGKRLRARVWITPLESAAAGWFAIDGATELLFEVGAEQSVRVSVAADPKAAPGHYSFRLDVASATEPDDEWANGPAVVFELAAPEVQPRRPFRWRRVALGAGGLLAFTGGAAVAFMLFGVPDLVVRDLRTSPSFPLSGDTVRVQVVVENIGDGQAGRFAVRFIDSEGGSVTTHIVDGLGAGATEVVTFNWRPGIAGAHNTVVIADSGSVITESDEENNELTAPIPVSLAGPSPAVATAFVISR